MTDIDKIAATLLQMRHTGDTINRETFTNLGTTIDAYRVQQAAVIASGSPVVGWKVALPPDGETIAAPILALDVIETGGSPTTFNQLKDGVELEIAFRIDRALPTRPQDGFGLNDVRAAIGAALPAFELLASRLPDGFASPRSQLIADRLGNGGVVLGSPRPHLPSVSFEAIEVEIRIDGRTILAQRGGNPVGDPLRAVAALAEHLHARGLSLQPGQFIMTGAYAGVHRMQPGQIIEGQFKGFKPISFTAPKQAPSNREEPFNAVG